jgi:hypothetical protein
MNLPAQGQWQLYDSRFPGNPPLGVLAVDFSRSAGTLQYLQQTTRLASITQITPTRFGAKYSIGRFQGLLEAELQNDGSLALKFLGTVNTSCSGRPLSITPVPDPNANLTPAQRALALVQIFEQKPNRGAFPNITRQQVADSLRTRIQNPGSLDQAQSSFCGPAAFMFCYLGDIVPYTKYVTELYDYGQSHIGSRLIRPSQGFRFDRLPSDSRAADWIALGSLRDSENFFFEYHRNEVPFFNAAPTFEFGNDLIEEMRGGTSASELVRWFHYAGYTQVPDFTGSNLAMSKARLANDYYNRNYRVCLSICSNMLDSKTAGNTNLAADHWVVLTSPIDFGGEQVSFNIYTWANKRWPVRLSSQKFWNNFFGFIAAGR